MPVCCKMFRQTLSVSERNWFDSLNPKSVDGFEELSNKFLEEFSQQKRYDKDPTEIHGIKRKPNEGLQAFMDRFKAESAHIKGVPLVLRISASFIRGETAADTTEVIRSPRWEKSAGKASWSENQNGSRNRSHRRGGGKGRNMGTYAPYAIREGFTPLTKTPNEILAMDNVNFPPPPLMVGTPKKRNMNKFCDYHQDRGYNTNDCYHLKKQIEKEVASGRLAHLVKDIRPYERVEHWMDNAIAFPSVPRYQLIDCPVVVDALIKGFRVRRIHVDGGSSSEVMYEHCFGNLSYRTRSRLKESRIPPVGFSGEVSYLLRVINLEVTMGECEKTRIVIIEFVVVKSPSPYNALLDPTLMQTSSEVANPRVSLASVETRSRRPRKEPMKLDDMEERRKLNKGKKPPKSSVKENIVVNDNYPEQLVTIGGGLSTECRHALIHTLRKNVNIFTWTPADMMGIPRAITEHSLDTYLHIELKIQKKRSLAPDRRKVVTDEVNEWLKAGIMTKKDEEKTAFHTEEGVFCYTKMPFGLKNVGATYQRLVDSAFKEQIGVNLEAYVDDMVIKSRTEQDIIKDIEQTFSTLRRINMKLNLKKCSCGMEEGKFLGYIVTSKGIRANPEKAKVVMDMPSPRTLKQMQSLNFRWTEAAEATFLEMKKLASELPTLTTPKKGAETNYAPMEKLTLALVHAAEQLRRYFQTHRIKVITDSPIGQVLNNSGASGRLAKWIVELGAYGITYVPRVVVKGQVLANFLADTPTEINATLEVDSTPRIEDIPESSNARENLTPGPREWRLYTDGALNNGGSRAGLILIAPDDVEYSYVLCLNFSNSNNDAECEALLAGLWIATEMQHGLKLKKCTREADLSKDTSGLEPQLEFRRNWYVEGHIKSGVISFVVMQRYQRTIRQRNIPCEGPLSLEGHLKDEGLCSGRTKLNSIFITAKGKNMTDSQSPEEGVGRVLLEFRVTGPQPWSVASFSPDNGHPSPTIISKIENTSRMVDIKPNKRPGSKKKLYPPSLPEQIFAPAIQQMFQIQKRSSGKQSLSANCEVCQLVDSPIILEALIEGFLVRRIYVDGGSSSEVIYEHCFRNLGAETRAKLKESRMPLVGFSGEVSYPTGTINLNVTMVESERLRTIPMEFAIVKSHSPYNVILGRTGLRSLEVVASTIHSMIKFLTADGIATVTTKKETLHECRRMEEA
ncbi:reverse transcriptase domain-containing protein [Tanacetum coccineum]